MELGEVTKVYKDRSHMLSLSHIKFQGKNLLFCRFKFSIS